MISLIIPCFNEEESLPLFYPEATSVLRQMNCDYELMSGQIVDVRINEVGPYDMIGGIVDGSAE